MKTTSIKVITNKINLIYVYVEIIEMYENTQNEEKNHILVFMEQRLLSLPTQTSSTRLESLSIKKIIVECL